MNMNLKTQRSQSAPVSPTKVYDKELAAFIQCEQQQLQQQLIVPIVLFIILICPIPMKHQHINHIQEQQYSL